MFFWFAAQCGKSTSTHPTQIICSHAQRMVHCCTGRLPPLQTCPPSYKASQMILSVFQLSQWRDITFCFPKKRLQGAAKKQQFTTKQEVM